MYRAIPQDVWRLVQQTNHSKWTPANAAHVRARPYSIQEVINSTPLDSVRIHRLNKSMKPNYRRIAAFEDFLQAYRMQSTCKSCRIK